MDEKFIIDYILYITVRNPYTNGTIISRENGLAIKNRKEIYWCFLRF